MRQPGPTPGEKSDFLLNTASGGLAMLAGQDPFGAVPDQAAVENEMLLRAANGLRTDDAIEAQVRAKHTPRPGMTITEPTEVIQARLNELARMRAARGIVVTDRGPDTRPRVQLPPGVAGL